MDSTRALTRMRKEATLKIKQTTEMQKAKSGVLEIQL
uniref:Uncharacterized protein n=1 Tax=Triticum urartu TaxID=4572 RepID=A0A8R7UZE6_TRIUA